MAQSTNWVFTWNSPPPQWQAGLADAPEVKYLVAGYEKAPTTGQPHIQGAIAFGARKSLRTVRKWFADHGAPNTHVEIMRGTWERNKEYCSKDGELLTYGVMPTQGGALSQAERWESARKAAKEGRMDDIPADLGIKYRRAFQEVRAEEAARLARISWEKQAPDKLIKDWQQEVHSYCMETPRDREILWIIDPVGGAGKTSFCDYMTKIYPERVQIFGPGNFGDLAYMLDVKRNIFLIDLPKCTGERMSWDFIEALKNGRVISKKYESCEKLFARPVVVVLSNNPPPPEAFMANRIKTKLVA